MVTVAGLEARRRDPKQRHWPHIKLSNLAGGGKGNAGKSSGFIGVGLGLGLEIPVKTGIRFGSRGGVLLGAETRKEKALRDGSRMAAREGVGPGCQQQKGGRGGSVCCLSKTRAGPRGTGPRPGRCATRGRKRSWAGCCSGWLGPRGRREEGVLGFGPDPGSCLPFFVFFYFLSFKSHFKSLFKISFEILLNFTQSHTVQKYKCSSMSAHTCY
jgi:hypothetical protein